jgi:hypothetical protein
VLRAIAGRSRGGSPADDAANGPSLRVLDGGGQGRPARRTDGVGSGNATLA